MNRRQILLSALGLPLLARTAAAQDAAGLAPALMPQEVTVDPAVLPGQIFVIPDDFHLYHILTPGRAMRYGVAVGAEGRDFKGEAIIERKEEWPSWRPTDEMIARDPERYEQYADGMPGGPDNPLGARALYLYEDGVDTYYRIHGTNDPSSIGRSVSNGCIRMRNEDAIELFDRVMLGTPVTVF
ncbi:L,D-transpeptidase [Pseudoroseicyclus aestuarii]|uniref:L,D-transpeptidase-like protein n=1 Tax=Pseudoroseicyclus aestuarii TaxID=1795041 RepID=A0A318SXX7_9RHOB|nr:L,D-transpeptidase [Pseudoroseicyclus aestuarii]PYE86175.1 L,D-transpeptidase-like protein [Pseudoroseicyclus aestuarii]